MLSVDILVPWDRRLEFLASQCCAPSRRGVLGNRGGHSVVTKHSSRTQRAVSPESLGLLMASAPAVSKASQLPSEASSWKLGLLPSPVDVTD